LPRPRPAPVTMAILSFNASVIVFFSPVILSLVVLSGETCRR
jgi:hypothetical protein